MMTLFLFVIIVAMVLGLIGAVVDGLAWLLAIAVVIFLADLFLGFRRMRHRRRRPVR